MAVVVIIKLILTHEMQPIVGDRRVEFAAMQGREA